MLAPRRPVCSAWQVQAGETFGLTVVSSRGIPCPGSMPEPEDRSFMSAFLVGFGVIFVAELGDKSQLMALAFATRYRAATVLGGITVATAVVHLISVLIGAVMGANLPTTLITVLAGLAFLGFAAWTLRGDQLDDDENARVRRAGAGALLAVGAAFFLAELGDKTMLATVTLATREGLVGTWAGSTVGMVAADALAIVVGQQLGARLPERWVRYGAAASFLVFGLLLLGEAAWG